MGRAFPELQMVLPTLAGIAATPMAIADEKGNTLVLDTVDNQVGRTARPLRDHRHGLLGDRPLTTR